MPNKEKIMSAKKEALLDMVYQEWLDAVLRDFSLDKLHEVVSDDVMGFGTTLDERIASIDGVRDFITRQREQGVGIEMEFDFNPVHRL